MTTPSRTIAKPEDRRIYDAYQKAQPADGYLLIGDKRKKKNGKQVIYAIPGRPESEDRP